MVENLKDILSKEKESLEKLLHSLESQHEYILKKDIFKMESVVEEIQGSNKEVAEWEVKRRRAVGNVDFQKFIWESEDEELENLYREIKKLLEILKLQKETNDLLIKQSLVFTNKLLNLINPRRDMDTYNSYGKINR